MRTKASENKRYNYTDRASTILSILVEYIIVVTVHEVKFQIHSKNQKKIHSIAVSRTSQSNRTAGQTYLRHSLFLRARREKSACSHDDRRRSLVSSLILKDRLSTKSKVIPPSAFALSQNPAKVKPSRNKKKSTMKTAVALLIVAATSVAGFAPAQPRFALPSALQAKKAGSKEEDLEMTRKVIAAFNGMEEEEPEKPEKAAAAEEVKEE